MKHIIRGLIAIAALVAIGASIAEAITAHTWAEAATSAWPPIGAAALLTWVLRDTYAAADKENR